MDAVEKGWPIVEKIYALLGIGMFLPLVLVGVLWLVLRHIGARTLTNTENIGKLTGLMEAKAEIEKSLVSEVKEGRAEIKEELQHVRLALAELKGRQGKD